MLQTPSTGSTPLSPLQQFALLPPEEREKILATLTDEQKADLAYQWHNWIARPDQEEPEGDWIYWFLKAGRGFGKTRVGAEWIRRKAETCRRLHLIAPTAADARDVMVKGDSGILAISPPSFKPEYFPTRRELVWPNGASALLFSGEDPESLRGPQCEALWADEIAAWKYPQDTWDMALLGLRLGMRPQACITSTPKPIRIVRDLVRDPDCVVTSGSTYANLTNLGPTYRTIIGRYEGTRLGKQELHAELLEDEGLAYRINERLHTVPPFLIPQQWERFGSMDYGWTNPSALLYWAVDYEGNCVIYDVLYEPGWPSELIPKIKNKKPPGTVWADPSMWIRASTTPKFGDPAAPADEFSLLGFPLVKANNDRRAGFMRMSEMLKLDDEHVFPTWHPLAGQPGAPRLFIFQTEPLQPLLEQLKDAPLEESDPGPNQGPHPGEAVAQKWERSNGHAHAAARYGSMTRPSPSKPAPPPPPDVETQPEEYARYARRTALIEHERRRAREIEQQGDSGRFTW